MDAFPPTRAEGLRRLEAFVPRAGRAYAASRNHDRPGAQAVSALSPYIRHRLVTEAEVLRAVVAAHGPEGAQRFVAEVFWRTYWKGWLEMRPAVWAGYETERDAALDAPGVARAIAGQTGIEGFDDWARELVTTGWLHNHARMWFASIWVFTLRLPWAAGADFFLRHLVDGDPASNTLSWRWVAGLQTRGKTYLAVPDAIAECTGGRFRPTGLATEAEPVEGPPPPEPRPIPAPTPIPAGPRALLLTEDDCDPWPDGPFVARAALRTCPGRSPLPVSEPVARFSEAALGGAALDLDGAAAWARDSGAAVVVTPYAPVGPAATALDRLEAVLARDGIALARPMRPYDRRAWPHATRGFYRFRDAIPELVAAMGTSTGPSGVSAK